MTNIFENDPFIRLRKERRIGSIPALRPGEIAHGNGWYIRDSDDGIELHYIAGEQGGGAKHIVISPDEAAQLAAGTTTVDRILIAHGF